MKDQYPRLFLIIFSLSLALLILWIDMLVSHGIAEGMAYVLLVLTGLMSGRIKYVYYMAILGTMLTLIGYLIPHGHDAGWINTTNRALAILIIWTTAILGVLSMKRESDLRALIETIVDGIITMDTHGVIKTFNKSAQNIFGYTSKEILGRNISELMPPPFRDEYISHIRQYLDTGEKRIIGTGREGKGLRKDGSVFPMELSISEIDSESNTNFIGVFRDISERKRVQEKLREEHQFNEQLVKTAHAIIVILDTQGRIIYINPYLEQLSHYSLEEVQGKDWFTTFLPEDEQGRIKNVFKQALSGVRTKGISNTILTRNGDRPLIEWFDNELFDSEGNLMGILAIGQDISGRRESERRIRELQNELLHASRMSTIGELGTALAHELNQPLTALVNYVHACRRVIDSESATARDNLGVLMDKAVMEADRAASIIVRLRNYFEEGSLERSSEDINKIILDACELITTEAEKRRINIACKLDEGLSPALIDRIQIQQVLFNLLNNSIQALENWVRREIIIKSATTPDNFIEVIVQDSGPGIEADHVTQNFRNVSSGKRQGMGVGLSICRSIIDAHGGKFWQTESPGGGATFHFTVPLAEHEEPGSE